MYVNINYLLEGDRISAKTINLQHTYSIVEQSGNINQHSFKYLWALIRDKDI